MAATQRFSRVPLGSASATLVADPPLVRFIQQMIAQSLRARQHPVSPPLPISPETEHASVIRNGPYLYSEKANGVRYFMVLCTALVNGAWRKLCVLSDRKQETFIVPLVIGERLFAEGCVFDGELVKTWSGRWLYLVFDTYLFEGEVTSTRPFLERSSLYQRFVDENYAYMPADAFCVRAKHFLPLRTAIPSAIRDIMAPGTQEEGRAQCEYPVDGIVLIHSTAPALAGTCRTMFKFKSVHTIDLRIEPHGDDPNLYVLCSARNETPRRGPPVVISTPHAVIESLPEYAVEGNVVECSLAWHAADERMDITPMCARCDKLEPNSTWVVERTMQTVKDALQIEDLLA